MHLVVVLPTSTDATMYYGLWALFRSMYLTEVLVANLGLCLCSVKKPIIHNHAVVYVIGVGF